MTQTPEKPRVFVASSRESEPIAIAIQACLGETRHATVWSQGIFGLSMPSLDSLLEALARFDFAVFLFMPEDAVTMRDQTRPAVRDNLVFELGLFLGRLGKRRTFIVAPQHLRDLHLPSDLAGLTRATFDDKRPDGNWEAAVAPACAKIRQAIQAQAPPHRPAADGWYARRIQEHEGIRTQNPMALAIDLLPNDGSIRGDVEQFLSVRRWDMRLELLKRRGIQGTADLEAFVEELRALRFRLTQLGATELHLFYAGPGTAAVLAGVLFDNWIPVKMYQKGSSAGELYEYWGPLVKN